MASDLTEGGWRFNRILGEGAYGEVHLLVNEKTMNLIAAKIIDVNNHKANLGTIIKEIQIHKRLNHENIIKCYGNTREDNIEYIFLEYASGGELFDRIEPDVGMSNADAFRYFSQLLNGVEYLHSLGIGHRDLKPENLLLNDQDVVKISDFGTATVFAADGKRFKSKTMCGTFPYMANEVYTRKEYYPDKADIWSCGIILVALLSGELPWDTPSFDSEGYARWKNQTFHDKGSWTKIDNLCLSLLKKVLTPCNQRYSIEEIRNTKWYQKYSSNRMSFKSQVISPIASRKRRAKCTNSSQPTKLYKHNDDEEVDQIDSTISQPLKSFSQPTILEDMVINTQCTQMSQSQGSYVNVYQRLVKRMTRFFTRLSVADTCDHLLSALEKMDYGVNKNASNMFTISTIDKRKVPLIFKATILEMKQNQVLVDFRLSRGCGLEFKKCYCNIKSCLDYIILSTPTHWTMILNEYGNV